MIIDNCQCSMQWLNQWIRIGEGQTTAHSYVHKSDMPSSGMIIAIMKKCCTIFNEIF